MSRTRIKICGIKDVDTALAAVDAGADAIGLVFVEKSPRHITVKQAKRIADALPAFVEPVGLFVDSPPDQIKHIAQEAGLKTIQLHGHESLAVLDELTGLSVIRAFAMQSRTKDEINSWIEHPLVKAVLIDTPPSESATLTGGSGQTFDWKQLKHEPYGSYQPLILAGGLTPRNVAQAIHTCSPYAVDVSSGVESSRGVKDSGLIYQFCSAVKDADFDRGELVQRLPDDL